MRHDGVRMTSGDNIQNNSGFHSTLGYRFCDIGVLSWISVSAKNVPLKVGECVGRLSLGVT